MAVIDRYPVLTKYLVIFTTEGQGVEEEASLSVTIAKSISQKKTFMGQLMSHDHHYSP